MIATTVPSVWHLATCCSVCWATHLARRSIQVSKVCVDVCRYISVTRWRSVYLPRRTPTRTLHRSLQIAYVYDYLTKICRKQEEVIQNHDNANVRIIGRKEGQRRKHKRLKFCGGQAHEGVSKSFRTGRLEWELQMVQLSATRRNCITILWVSLVSFATITFCVASQRMFISLSTQSGNFCIHPRKPVVVNFLTN
jgi:hypothetical protein